MRFTEIDAISLEDALAAMGEVVEIKKQVDDPELTADQNYYNEIVITGDLEKQPFTYYENIMKEHKFTLKEERKAELRTIAGDRAIHAMYKRGVVYTEAPKLIEKYISEDNEDEILKIVGEIVEIERDEKERKTIAFGRKVREVSQNTLDYITGMNKNRTAAEVDAIEAEFAFVAKALASKRPGKALKKLKNRADQITSVTQEEYNLIISYIERELLSLSN